ncbi:helix-turn-helix transcriptional regulator [Salinicoccus sp. ID82-1]|uniref:helix-turn-helix domain-containing protein n=1 Tax=Salinicoccus sp. ID82-1 TaxID=2820269 RepID=UPI001F26B006|nr:helix-turn-helix domain-containing protein [Salinicoccus sp. ID82-1]MCG1010830.1 helix-turn-helix transcriptional regulator [Salinicoccus sp. ID82-1]
MRYHIRFKEIRQQKGFTHKDLAEGICGMTTIYRFERGDTAIAAEVLYKLCQRLGVAMQTLFVDDDSEYALIDHYLDMLREYVYFSHEDLLKVTLQDAKETINDNPEFDMQYRNYERVYRTYTAIDLRNDDQFEASEKILLELIAETKNVNRIELEIINTLGDLYLIMDRYEDALALYHRHRERIMDFQHVNDFDQYMIIQLHYGYAICLYNSFSYVQALDVCYRLLIRIQENNSIYYLGKTHHLMALIQIALNDPEPAKEHIAKCEAAFFLEDLDERMEYHIQIARDAIEALAQ